MSPAFSVFVRSLIPLHNEIHLSHTFAYNTLTIYNSTKKLIFDKILQDKYRFPRVKWLCRTFRRVRETEEALRTKLSMFKKKMSYFRAGRKTYASKRCRKEKINTSLKDALVSSSRSLGDFSSVSCSSEMFRSDRKTKILPMLTFLRSLISFGGLRSCHFTPCITIFVHT